MRRYIELIAVALITSVLITVPQAQTIVYRFSRLIVTDPTTDALDVAGGANFGSGNVQLVAADGRIPAINTTTFASVSAANLTAVPASQLTGLVPSAALGTGLADSAVFLRGDRTWATVGGGGGGGAEIPTGLISLFDTACPSGWTRFAALDGRMPQGSTTYGTVGGGATHTHNIVGAGTHSHTYNAATTSTNTDHTHGGNTSIVNLNHGHAVNLTTNTVGQTVQGLAPGGESIAYTGGHNHTVSGDTSGMSANVDHLHSFTTGGMSANAAHAHTASGTTAAIGDHSHTADAGSSLPPFITVVYCRKS
jgi:hypothetical protein